MLIAVQLQTSVLRRKSTNSGNVGAFAYLFKDNNQLSCAHKHLKYMTIYKQFAFSFLWVILISWMAEFILYGILQLSLFSSSNCSLFQCPSTSKTEKYLESLKTSVSLGCLKEDPFLHLSERTELLRGHPSNLHPLLITDLYLAKIFRPYNRWNFSALFASAVDSERRKNLSLWMNNDNQTRKRHFHLWSH